MKDHMHNKKKQLLTHAVLASTLFVAVPHAVHADTTVNTATVAPLNTTANGPNISVTAAGSIAAVAADAVTFNGPDNSTLLNYGDITSTTLSAVHVTTGKNGVITNGIGGLLFNDAAGATKSTVLIDAAGGGMVINNAGLIEQSKVAAVAFDAIEINGPFSVINNNANGVIQNIGGATSTGHAINVNADAVGANINNNLNATINATGLGAGISLDGDFGTITNAGLIQNTSTKSAIVLNAAAGTNTVTGIVNSGDIVAPYKVIFNSGANGTTITNGLINTGTIFNTTAGGDAIDFQTNVTSATVFQQAGIISGNVLLAQQDAALGTNVLTMTGGTIAGDVNAANVVGKTNTLNLSGGVISGVTRLGNQGDTVVLSGTALNVLFGGTGIDTYNVTGGSFNTLDGNAGADIFNVNASFTSNGIIRNVPNVNVNNGALGTVFTNNGTISDVNTALTVTPGTTFLQNGTINNSTGNIVINKAAGALGNGRLLVQNQLATIDLSAGAGQILNSGTTELGTNAILTVQANPAGTAGVFTNNAGGTLQIDVGGITVPGGATTAGQMVINDIAPGSANLAAGSFVRPVVTGFVPYAHNYNVITVNDGQLVPTGTVTDNSTLVQPPSANIYFTKQVVSQVNPNDTLQLTGYRRGYSSLSSTQVTKGVAGTLDVLAQGNGPIDQGMLNLLIQLDTLPTQQDVELAMESLVPPYNFGMAKGAQQTMQMAYDGLESRMEDNRLRRRAKGQNMGDPAGAGSVWVKGLGAHLSQSDRDGLDGYKADAWGIAIGADWGVNECFTLGLAGSYGHVDVDDKSNSPKDQNVKSWQGTIYSQMLFKHGIYLDAMVSGASEDFNTNRQINVGNIHTAAQADFDGSLWGAQADLGWLSENCDYYWSPFARLRYSHLDIDDYTETGAGSLNLAVSNDKIDEFMGGLGIKIGGMFTNNDVMYVPEISAMFGYDFTNDGEVTSAAFFGGGPAFLTEGVEQGRTVFNLGLSLNTHVSTCTIFKIKYNLEVRDSFVGNAGLLQFSYLWG